jgi:hypothetical protein
MKQVMTTMVLVTRIKEDPTKQVITTMVLVTRIKEDPTKQMMTTMVLVTSNNYLLTPHQLLLQIP